MRVERERRSTMPRRMLRRRLLALLGGSAALSWLSACRDEGALVRIEQLTTPDSIAVGESIDPPLREALAAIAPAMQVRTFANDAAALAAVGLGSAAALVHRVDPAAAGGLALTPVEGRPVGLFVPFTFPVEEVTAAQARALVSGVSPNWRDAGGPALAAQVFARDPEAASDALGVSVRATATEDVTATLAAGRGRLVLAPGDWAGPVAKPLRVDGRMPGERGYPFPERWAIAARPGDRRAETLARDLSRRAAGRSGDEVVLDAAGDIMLGREVGAFIAARGARTVFEPVTALLEGSDIRFANLELPLTERGTATVKDYVFRAPPAAVDGLTSAGFNVVTLANNHILDYGPDGLLDTIAALDRAGIAHVGAGRTTDEAHAPAIVAVNNLSVAFLGYVNTPDDSRTGWVAASMRADATRPGVAWGTPDAIRRDVAAARSKADLVLVAVHAGWEYTNAVNAVQRELARAAVDAGAAAVLGAHPHVLQGIEIYRGVPIAYSLGNFVFDLDDDDRRVPGLPSVLTGVLRLRLGREGVRALEFRPAIIDQRDGRPRPVQGAEARRVLDRLYTLSDQLPMSVRP
jgi:poly-gamma-glutamate capsule biosynthesis protein CapA/YwtB (metallophosphatase superfamily)